MNFYCQQKCGGEDFSIDEWNKAFDYCIENSLSEEETGEILEGTPCEYQCIDCSFIVKKTRMKNVLKGIENRRKNGE